MIDSDSNRVRRTRFIATLGPATEDPEMISQLIQGGVNVFRLNMSHASHDWAREISKRIRASSAELQEHVAVLFDLQGPSIRTGDLDEPYQINRGDRIEFRRTEAQPTEQYSTTVNYDDLLDDVSVGDTLIIDNGTLLAEIEAVKENSIVCEAKSTGPLGSRRHINLPGVRLSLPALTEKDIRDIDVAVECEADFIAGSFVRDASHVGQLRSAIEDRDSNAQIVSKLEDQEAIRNLDSIIIASDAIMVARGDLGIEVHIEELPILQRRIIKQCHTLGRRVIVATHMLESMISNPTPTRAEVTDISNAVYEQADALMLSGETSVGKHPLRCIEILDRVSRRIERSGGLGYRDLRKLSGGKQKVIRSAVNLAESFPKAHILVFTRSGSTAHQAALMRPRNRIYAFTPHDTVCRTLSLSRGVIPCVIPFAELPRNTVKRAIDYLKEVTDVAPSTPLVVLSDIMLEGQHCDSILLLYA